MSPRIAARDGPLVVSPGLTASEGALELLPMPVALVRLARHGLVTEISNRLFTRAGLQNERGLDEALTAFLRSGTSRGGCDFHAGGAVERRYYRVSFARNPSRAEPVCLVCFIDQTAEVRTEATLRREMSTDSLTGLPNRSGFSDALEAMVAAGAARWAVLVIDLERFSRLNACLGSLTGDELLITAARRLKGVLRARDVLARTGGDEFGVLLAIDEQPGEADRVAARIRQAFAAPFRLSDYELRLSCAIGIAFGDAHVGDTEDVIRHAQVAMKRSKTTKAAESYQTSALDTAREEFALETALRRAIEHGDLDLVYQPICDLATGRIAGFEALSRWTGEDGRRHDPARFIAVAEESGLIVPLGRWALDTALRTLAGWDRAAGGDCGVAIAVNLSPIQLQRDDVPQMVACALDAAGVAGSRLKLELTESAIMTDPVRITAILMALKDLGVTIAMDDFGTGYSSLASLQRLPIDILKIDRSFVTGMLADPDERAIIRAILGMAQALNMVTVAEGIEAAETGEALAALGCRFGQGYVYSPPLGAEGAYALLASRNA